MMQLLTIVGCTLAAKDVDGRVNPAMTRFRDASFSWARCETVPLAAPAQRRTTRVLRRVRGESRDARR
jgi:hypothetical protein